MKKITKLVLWLLVPLAALLLYAYFIHCFQKRYVPPQGIKNIAEVLAWTGRPWWVVKYSSSSAVYYEVGMKVPVSVLMLTLASGAPSYTVDENGSFIGWSPDSGDVHTPEVLRMGDLKRESINVDAFMQLSKEMTPNQALERTRKKPRASER